MLKRLIAAATAAMLLWVQPAAAQSILRDAETEALLNDMSAPLITAAGLRPRDVQIVMLNDDSINAFVAGGQIVYVHSGLIQAADNANEVQGVIAHELGHIADGHIILQDAALKPALGITLLSMVIGLAAIAAGAGEAGAGILGVGQQAALGKYLAFSRVQESTADASAVKYLNKAGITGKGMLSFFKKLQGQEFRYGLNNIDPFMQTHPLSGERIQTMSADLQGSAAWSKPAERHAAGAVPEDQGEAERLFAAEPPQTLNKYPDTDQTVYAHYARAYAYHKGGYPAESRCRGEWAGQGRSRRPLFSGDQGTDICSKPASLREALAPLRLATEGTRNNPLIATTLGHALIATEDKANLSRSDADPAQRSRARRRESVRVGSSSAPSTS